MNSENKQESVPSDTTKTIDPMSVPNVCCGIYGLRNKVNDKWYVGQSLDIYDRWHEYDTLHCKSQRKLYAALLKYGVESFDKVVLEECSSSDLDTKEDDWINTKDSIKNGYNCKGGGSHGKMSDETREKIRQSLTGRKLSDDHKRRIGAKHSGKVISAETRKKISDKAKSRNMVTRTGPHSIESIQKMRNAKIGMILHPNSRAALELGIRRGVGNGRPLSDTTKLKISAARRARTGLTSCGCP